MNEKPPSKLGAPGLGLWVSVVEKYDLRPDELRVLEHAAREQSLIAKMQTALDKAPMTVKGSTGQPVVHPLVGEIRQHRSTLGRLLGQLKLPDEAAGKDSRSAKNRDAANARWRRTG